MSQIGSSPQVFLLKPPPFCQVQLLRLGRLLWRFVLCPGSQGAPNIWQPNQKTPQTWPAGPVEFLVSDVPTVWGENHFITWNKFPYKQLGKTPGISITKGQLPTWTHFLGVEIFSCNLQVMKRWTEFWLHKNFDVHWSWVDWEHEMWESCWELPWDSLSF